MKFRRVVHEVEAYQLTAAMIDAHLLDEAPLPKGLRLARAGYHRGNRVVYNATFSVTTIHGEDARVVVNDWIITEMDGEHFYPCKPEIFAVDYEAVGAPHPGLGSALSLSSPIEPPRGEIYQLGFKALAVMIRCEYPDFDENHVSESLARIASRAQASSEIREATEAAITAFGGCLCTCDETPHRRACNVVIATKLREALAPSRQGAGGK